MFAHSNMSRLTPCSIWPHPCTPPHPTLHFVLSWPGSWLTSLKVGEYVPPCSDFHSALEGGQKHPQLMRLRRVVPCSRESLELLVVGNKGDWCTGKDGARKLLWTCLGWKSGMNITRTQALRQARFRCKIYVWSSESEMRKEGRLFSNLPLPCTL